MITSDCQGGLPSEVPLTNEERRALRAFKRLADNWPQSLWLFSASGTLQVMRHDVNGKMALDGEGCDARYKVFSTRKIPNDGGDW